MTVAKPASRPTVPHFSSGPCAKRPGWNPQNLKDAALGRSHRAKIGKTRLKLAIDLTREVLKNVLEQDDKAITIESIQKFVADYHQLKTAELKSRNNSKSVAMPRQIAMYLCKTLTQASLPEIGKSFGGKHHSTVIHSIKKVEELRKNDGDFNKLISSFLESFR